MTDWPFILALPLWFWLFIFPFFIGLFGFFAPQILKPILKPVWSLLDTVYYSAGIIGAFFLICILAIIVAQMIFRWSGWVFAGSTDYAGYCMAAASFFALAHALNRGAHIRVSILLNANRFMNFWLDAAAMVVAAVIGCYFARFAVKANIWSKLLNDRTQGQDTTANWVLEIPTFFTTPPTQWPEKIANLPSGTDFTPMWFPQLAMSIGAIIFAIALWDNFIRLMTNRRTNIKEDVVKEGSI